MKNSKNTRRYYLHRKIKGKVSIHARQRIISLPEASYKALEGKLRTYVLELKEQFNYKIQYSIEI